MPTPIAVSYVKQNIIQVILQNHKKWSNENSRIQADCQAPKAWNALLGNAKLSNARAFSRKNEYFRAVFHPKLRLDRDWNLPGRNIAKAGQTK